MRGTCSRAGSDVGEDSDGTTRIRTGWGLSWGLGWLAGCRPQVQNADSTIDEGPAHPPPLISDEAEWIGWTRTGRLWY